MPGYQGQHGGGSSPSSAECSALVTFAIVETGLLWWLKSGMELTASLTARCGAIGYTYPTASNVLLRTRHIDDAKLRGRHVAGLVTVIPNVITANSVTVNGPRDDVQRVHRQLLLGVGQQCNFFKCLPHAAGEPITPHCTTSACYLRCSDQVYWFFLVRIRASQHFMFIVS